MSPFVFRPIVYEERSSPMAVDGAYPAFVQDRKTGSVGFLLAEMAHEYGRWSDVMSREETAYALSQVTAANTLPPLTRLTNGCELLDYYVRLREVMSALLVAELAAALRADSRWQQVQANGYLCPIGAGVAAFLETTSGEESLSLRYANTLVPALMHAHHAADIPRSLPLLQTALYDRFDALLIHARASVWFWLAG